MTFCIAGIAELNNHTTGHHTYGVPDIRAHTCRIAGHKVIIAMTVGLAFICKLKYLAKRCEHADGVPDIRTYTCRIARNVITEACAFSITPVVKFNDFARRQCHANRIIDIRTPKRTWTDQCIAFKVVGVAVTFGKTRVFKLQSMSIWCDDTNGIPDRRTDATCITRIIITIPCTLCKTPVVEDKNFAILGCHADWFIDFRTCKWTWTERLAIEIIEVSMTLCETIVVKL